MTGLPGESPARRTGTVDAARRKPSSTSFSATSGVTTRQDLDGRLGRSSPRTSNGRCSSRDGRPESRGAVVGRCSGGSPGRVAAQHEAACRHALIAPRVTLDGGTRAHVLLTMLLFSTGRADPTLAAGGLYRVDLRLTDEGCWLIERIVSGFDAPASVLTTATENSLGPRIVCRMPWNGSSSRSRPPLRVGLRRAPDEIHWPDLFTDDVVFRYSVRGDDPVERRGRDEVLAMLGASMSDDVRTRHLLTNVLVESLTRDECVLLVYFALLVTDTDCRPATTGFYRLELRGAEGRWRIARVVNTLDLALDTGSADDPSEPPRRT
ncbi:nuclear transport factor 2 family protein [Streptomyces sp. L7]